MGKLWQRIVNDGEKSRVEEVALDGVRITRPTIVYLSGFLTNNNRPDYINGSIKRVQELIKGRPELSTQPPIYGWTHTNLRNVFNLAVYDCCPQHRSSQAGYDLGRAILMPLVTKNMAVDDKGHITGSPLPADEVKKNLKNVTFFGYSAGTVVAQETYNATLKMMKGVGYAEKDARSLLNEVVLIAVGTISRPSQEINRFTTVYLTATNDRLNRAKNLIWGTIGTLWRALFGNYAKKNKPLAIRPLSKTSISITAPVRGSLYEWEYDESGQKAKKKFFDPLYPKWAIRRSYHELPHYVTTDENNNPFANIALYATLNAVNRSAKPDPMKLIEATGSTTTSEIAYAAKITAALKPAPKALARRMRM